MRYPEKSKTTESRVVTGRGWGKRDMGTYLIRIVSVLQDENILETDCTTM